MNCKLINVLMFAAGAAIGSAVTWKVVKTKYERIVQEEIESVKEVFGEMMSLQQQDDDETSENDEDADERPSGTTSQINWDELEDLDESEEDEDYSPNVGDLREYGRLIDSYTNEKGGADVMTNEPYVISPFDYGELDGYRTFELTYYADNILEDDEYNIVTDVDDLLGPKALYTFGEYEDDSVFVRNEKLHSDFQILRDPRTYEEARSIGPNQVDDE